jgi:hypothetical protein
LAAFRTLEKHLKRFGIVAARERLYALAAGRARQANAARPTLEERLDRERLFIAPSQRLNEPSPVPGEHLAYFTRL